MSLKIRYSEAGAATPQRLQSGATESVDSPVGLLIGVKCTLLNLRWIRWRWRGPGEWGGGRGWKRQSPQWEQSLLWGQIQYKRTSAICALHLLPTPCQFTSVCCGSLAEVQQHNSFNNSHIHMRENLWISLMIEWFYTLCCESSEQPDIDPLSSIYNRTRFPLAALTTGSLLNCDSGRMQQSAWIRVRFCARVYVCQISSRLKCSFSSGWILNARFNP